jgi:multimeric flavodoxin WrbA
MRGVMGFMKLLIINATPKTDGICYSFVTTAAETAAALGIEAEVIRLSGMDLTKCKMCGDGWGICFKEHICEFGEKDGFNGLQKKVEEADAYVYITPVYWGEVSEELKIFLDKLRRCQATKQWDGNEDEVSFHTGKPSIIVASAGGGGGGIVTTFADIERAIQHMGGDGWPRETNGIFDYIAVNRWNQAYKREALKAAVTEMIKHKK